jgi:3-oxoacyl-[acyl-carrier protein] reductase
VAAAYGSARDPAEALVAELAAAGATARSFESDLARVDGPGALVDAVEQSLGPVDVLVANHGVGRVRRWEELSPVEWDHTLAVNLRAPFLLAQRVLPGMCEHGFGRMLFMSSTAAFRGGALAPDYAASKSGLHGMMHFLAARVAGRGVTVNAIAPGYVRTAMMPGDPAELGARVPVGRVGEPEEVGRLALAILTNGYMTSHVVALDGGIYPR